MSKPGFATLFSIPTGMLNHLGNETRAYQTVQMYRLSFPLVVRIWHKLVFWREIKGDNNSDNKYVLSERAL